ncbi:MAG: putative sulfate exporter family transporter [Bacteroidota bacterium]|nr:putative sulfate exporter family transporter [Bacteroidota bacterium]
MKRVRLFVLAVRRKQEYQQVMFADIAFIILFILCATSWVSAPIALLTGIVAAQLFKPSYQQLVHKFTHFLLQFSVVGLGFGMNLHTVVYAGKEGLGLSVLSIIITLLAGVGLGRIFATDKKTSYLIASGTAICGGSAIAAVAPVINAGKNQMSVALGTVFLLNTFALFLFPFIGHLLHLSDRQFGLWCALAIHDTSSVVGAAGHYSNSSLEIATVVKLARALWIIPVAIISAFAFKGASKKIKLPYFIALFVVAVLINTWLPGLHQYNKHFVSIAKTGFTLTLFLIGTGLPLSMIKDVGVKPFLQGLLLWIFISVLTLSVIVFLR